MTSVGVRELGPDKCQCRDLDRVLECCLTGIGNNYDTALKSIIFEYDTVV